MSEIERLEADLKRLRLLRKAVAWWWRDRAVALEAWERAGGQLRETSGRPGVADAAGIASEYERLWTLEQRGTISQKRVCAALRVLRGATYIQIENRLRYLKMVAQHRPEPLS
jgi:hypothetical protein